MHAREKVTGEGERPICYGKDSVTGYAKKGGGMQNFLPPAF